MSETEKQAEPTDSPSRWKLTSFLLAGVLIPILASLLPWTLEHWVPEHKLTYSLDGPISAPKAGAFALRIKNEGSSPQNNLEIWIPLNIIPQIDPEVRSDGTIDLNEKEPSIILETSTEPTKKETKGDFTILYYQKLRPDEFLDIRLFVVGTGAHLSEYHLERMRIVSDNTLAQLDKPSEELAFMFKVGSFLFILFIVPLFGYAIYYENFMPAEKKRAELRKQLDKLG